MNLFISDVNRSKVCNFCWRHRGKIAAASMGIGAVLGAAYYYYDGDEGEDDEGTKDETVRKAGKNSYEGDNICPDAATQMRTKEFMAVNDLFDFSLVYFLPTIKQKVKEVVDVTDTVKKLKELMKSDNVPDQHQSKSALWKEIQLSAFTSVLTSSVAVSAASQLLMVQMHLLVKQQRQSSHSSFSSLDQSGVFQKLMEETFGVFFSSGISDLAQMSKCAAEEVCSEMGWTVESTLEVRFEDLRDLLMVMKQRVVGGEEGVSRRLSLMFHHEDPGCFLPSVESSRLADGGSILKETWEVMRSVEFERAFFDTTEAVFSFLSEQLWQEVFRPLEQFECDFPPLSAPDRSARSGTASSSSGGTGGAQSPISCLMDSADSAASSSLSSPSSPASGTTDSCADTLSSQLPEVRNASSDRVPEHKFQEASIPLAKLLPKIKCAANKLIPDDQHSKGCRHVTGEYGFRLPQEDVTRAQRSPSLQRIRALCGADDPLSSSFSLCQRLLANH